MRIGLQTWGSEGDIRPFTALAAGLVSAGHQVTLILTDDAGRDYSSLAGRYQFALKVVPGPASAHPADVEQIRQRIFSARNPMRQAELIMTYGFDPITEDLYQAAGELCAANDLVIGHFFVFPLRVAAAKANVPIATVNIVHNCIPSKFICPPGMPDLGRWFYPLGWMLARKLVNRIFLPRVNALRTREGLPLDQDAMDDTWAADRLNLIAVSPHICQRPPDWDARHQVCGFLNPPPPGPEEDLPPGLECFLSAGPAPVYMTFGSMMPRDPEAVRSTVAIWQKAAKQAGCRAILQVPLQDMTNAETNASFFVVDRAPYQRVFPCCSVIVHHGGAGTTQASLLAGRPSVVVAHVADQTFWGAELARLGVAGRTLARRTLTPSGLAREILKVLATPSMSEQARTIGVRMAAEDGVKNAVSIIERTFTG